MATKTATSKSTKVKAIPDGYHSVTPYLIIDGAAARSISTSAPSTRRS